MTKEELDSLIAKMTPSERSEFFALVAAEKKEPQFYDPQFKLQTDFLEDPARMKAVLCTRRSGKSYGAGLMLFREAYSQANVSCLYVALTRASAKRIMWKDVLKTIDREQGLQCKFNETELSITLPNGSVIYLLGMDADEQEKDKALGQKFKAVVIDEAASYNVDLHEMVYGILKPATADYRGVIAMIGTPGNMKRGLFYDLTIGQDPSVPGRWDKLGWSCHRWSAFDNPHMAEKWREEIEDLRLANPNIEQTPLFQQHYLGKWVTDDTKLVYRFDSSRNVFDELPVLKGNARWRYVLGIDLGFNDPTAWVVCAYNDFDRTLYVIGAHKKQGCDITEVADQTHRLMGKFQFDSIIIDNANRQAVEEIRRRHDIPLTPAQKHGKADFIEILNGDLISGYIKLHRKAAAPLIDELMGLVWDERALPRREEHPAAPNHCCFVDGTLVTTARGDVPIETVTDKDLVLTRDGWRPVVWCVPTGNKPVYQVEFSDGRSLTGTEEHPIYTKDGWKPLSQLTPTDVCVTSVPCANSMSEARQRPLSGMDSSGDDGLSQRVEATASTSKTTRPGCIEPCGSITSDQFPKDITSITRTETRSTTTFQTLSVFLRETIIAVTRRLSLRHSERCENSRLPRPSPRHPNGTLLQRVVSGIAGTLRRLLRSESESRSSARSVELSSSPGWHDARFVAERVTPAGTARVWALKVAGTPEYFANGVLVHNCDAMLYSWRHCYQYLADQLQSNGLRYGHTESDWMLLQHETELERQLEEKRYREQELSMWEPGYDTV